MYISKEDVNTYKRLGYNGTERVGFEGIEKWGEQYLHGRDQASLYVDGAPSNVLAQADSQPADSIYLTIDNDLQQQAQAAMDGLPGAIVVMEVNTGKVLAMVSSPSYDPNLYDANNFNSSWRLTNMLNDPNQPTFNRATQGQYPLGSVFKIITMAAALESGVFTPASTYDCEYDFTDIPGTTLYDWTWQDCQTRKTSHRHKYLHRPEKPAQRHADPAEGPDALVRPLVLPYRLYPVYPGWRQVQGRHLEHGQGLWPGQGHRDRTGCRSHGNIPDPTDGLDATSIAIGQGKVLVTPLQVATFISAVANGGTLYRPQLVEKVQPVSGDPINVFNPQANGTLPVSAENLAVIQAAMRQVAVNPRGTAYYTLGNFSHHHRRQDRHRRDQRSRTERLVRRIQPGRQSQQAGYCRGGARQQ